MRLKKNHNKSSIGNKIKQKQQLHGLVQLTNMYNIALNKNIIPHTCKLANIILIQKPNKYINMVTLYRPISLISVIAKHYYHTSQKNIPHISTQQAFKATTLKHYTMQHNNTIATGFNRGKSAEITTKLQTLHDSKVHHTETTLFRTIRRNLAKLSKQHTPKILNRIWKVHRYNSWRGQNSGNRKCLITV